MTVELFDAPSLWIPVFMALDKLHWLPIHSLMLMFDQLLSGACSLLTRCENIPSWHLSQFMSGISFVGNLYVYLIVFENTDQIQTKYQIQIHALLWFSIQLQIQKKFVFKYNCKYRYVFESNPDSHPCLPFPTSSTFNLPLFWWVQSVWATVMLNMACRYKYEIGQNWRPKRMYYSSRIQYTCP